jgi:hypothetical protein
MEADKEKSLTNITDAVARQVTALISAKKTGKYELKIELNLSQGGLGPTYLETTAREKI